MRTNESMGGRGGAVQIRASKSALSTVFYFPSFTRPGEHYAVRLVRRPGMRGWSCECRDQFWRQSPRRRHCKHIRAVRELARAAGGVRKLADYLIANGGQ